MKIPAVAVGALLLTTGAFAAEEQAATPPPTQEATRASVRMEAVEIKGEYENPDVFFIIPRRKASMDLGNLMIDYSREIGAPLLPHRFAARYAGRGEGEVK